MYRKLVIAGEVGSGKTQLINNLSEIDTLKTEALSTVNIGKRLTTVGIDYGRINIDEQTAIGLYGVPGQERYSFIWRMVSGNMWGLLVLVKCVTTVNYNYLKRITNFYLSINSNIPICIGITHCEDADELLLKSVRMDIKCLMNEVGFSAPIFQIDPRNTSSSRILLIAINSINNTIRENEITHSKYE